MANSMTSNDVMEPRAINAIRRCVLVTSGSSGHVILTHTYSNSMRSDVYRCTPNYLSIADSSDGSRVVAEWSLRPFRLWICYINVLTRVLLWGTSDWGYRLLCSYISDVLLRQVPFPKTRMLVNVLQWRHAPSVNWINSRYSMITYVGAHVSYGVVDVRMDIRSTMLICQRPVIIFIYLT